MPRLFEKHGLCWIAELIRLRIFLLKIPAPLRAAITGPARSVAWFVAWDFPKQIAAPDKEPAMSGYGHRVRKVAYDHYRVSWTVDFYYPDSRLRHPRSFSRDTDAKGAERFAKKWKLGWPVDERGGPPRPSSPRGHTPIA